MLAPFAPKKSLGQNFLQDANIIRKIAAALNAPEDASVIEIGAGTGALTEELLQHHQHLTAIEIDERAIAYLQEKFPQLHLIHADILQVKWRDLDLPTDTRHFVLGNLPYYITSQILFSILDGFPYIERAILMMQLEVAERLIAMPRTKEYGILSVWTQLFSVPKVLFSVSKNVFYPKPEVTSAVVGLDINATPQWTTEVEVEWVRKVVRMAFNQRRKTLRNSLKQLGEVPEQYAMKRAEELQPLEFVVLSKALALNAKP
jgi:16S rRNA (adenine1518-N6/adenine1519-N6)-dimethyltransferase